MAAIAAFFRRLQTKLRRLNGNTNVGERLSSSRYRDQVGGPRNDGPLGQFTPPR